MSDHCAKKLEWIEVLMGNRRPPLHTGFMKDLWIWQATIGLLGQASQSAMSQSFLHEDNMC